MSFDWNRDGKSDWLDGALFCEMTGTTEENESRTVGNRPQISGGVNAGKWIINGLCFLCLFIVYQLYCTGVEINSFSALLCLGCVIRLAYSFLSSL